MRRIACLLVVSCVWGCSSRDKSAPPPPRIEPVETPTALTEVTIHGSAEPGSTIVMSGADKFVPAEITADRFTSSFEVVATLKAGADNKLSFVAKDHAGNASEPTVLDIVQEHGHGIPSKLSLQLLVNGATQAAPDPVVLKAGDKVHAVTQAVDEAGHVLDIPVAISTSIPNAFVAGSDVSNIRSAGQFAIAATAAGSSLALSRDVTVQAGAATEITLDVSLGAVMAGTTVYVTAVAHDAYGNVVPDAAIQLTSKPALKKSYKPACAIKTLTQGFLDAHRFVAYDLSSAASNSYGFEITATSGKVTASTPVTVRPGPAARFAPLDPSDCSKGDAFAFTDSTWNADITGPLAVAAGESVYYRYAVIDAYGNVTTGPVNVVTSAPGANVIDDGVTGVGQVAHLSTAGMFDLSAYVAGVAAPAVKSFTVDVGNAHSANVFLSSTLASPGDTVHAFATIHDAYGNAVPCVAGAVDPNTLEILGSPTPSSAGATTCSDGLFQRDFMFSTSGTYTITTTYKPNGPVSASAFVTVLGIDATPPTVSIANILVDGVGCTPAGAPPACSVTRGATVEFDLVGNDNIALSELEYSAFFQTTGTLRTRTVLVSANSTLPEAVHFLFTVPNGVLPEDVPLVGMATDGSGNRASTDQLILRVGVFATFGRAVSVVASGGTISAPTDIAFNAAGDMFIGNDGNQELLEIASGASAPVVFSSFNRNSRYLTVDGGGNIYVTDTTRISKIDPTGATVVNYLQLAGGQSEGMCTVRSTVARGVVDASAANDGATVLVAGQTFELDSAANGCNGGAVCVTLGANTKNQALAAAIAGNSAMVNASVDAGSGKVVLAARSAGEAGDALTLSTTGMTISGATLTQGHAEELFFAQTNDNNIYRLPEDLTPTAMTTANHGAFNVATGQRGLAVKDMSSAASLSARDLYLYFVDTQNTNTVRAYHAVDAAAPTQVFAIGNGGAQNFGSLYDAVLEPISPVPATNPVNGCLLVSDSANGDIYAIDTRTPSAANPTVTRVASGFSDPRGLAFYNGDLYIADRGNDAIIKLSPSPSSSDCF